MKLNWVTLRVSNLQKSLFFYTQILKLGIAEQFGNEQHQIVMLGDKDKPKVELIYEKDVCIENPGNGVSIGLEADDLDQLIDDLKENKYEAQGPVSPNPQIRFFFVKDPDGYTIQLVEQS